MKKKVQSIIAVLVLSVGFSAMALVPVPYVACTSANSCEALLLPTQSVVSAKAATPASGTCSSASTCVNSGLQATGGSSSKTDINDIIKTIVNVLLFIIASISVIMIIIGGIKYTISQGDQNSVTSAKNTILYAVVGLMVAIFAYAIVNFVVSHFI